MKKISAIIISILLILLILIASTPKSSTANAIANFLIQGVGMNGLEGGNFRLDAKIKQIKSVDNVINIEPLINDPKLFYLKSLIYFYAYSSETTPNGFSEALKKASLQGTADIYLGLYTSDISNHWVINSGGRYAGYSDYQNYTRALREVMQDTNALYSDYGQVDINKYKLKLLTALSAGLSAGYIPKPDAKAYHKGMSVEQSIKRAFKIKQQGLRQAIINQYQDEIFEQKRETIAFLKASQDICTEFITIQNFDIKPTAIDAGPDIFVKGTGSVTYLPVIAAMQKQTAQLFANEYRKLTLICYQLAMLSWQATLQTTANELQLYQLNALFSLLQQKE